MTLRFLLSRWVGCMGQSFIAKAVEEALVSVLPTIALGTDLIVIFLEKTDKEFDESYEFCRQMGFSKIAG